MSFTRSPAGSGVGLAPSPNSLGGWQPRRARQACVRCRKQKLKCDDKRPCTLCVRSRVSCQEHPANAPISRKRKRLNANQPAKSSARDEFRSEPDVSPSPSGRVTTRPDSSNEPRFEQNGTHDVGEPCLATCPDSTSSYELIQDLFQTNETTSPHSAAADAIPRSHISSNAVVPRADGAPLVPVSELLDVDLPPRYVAMMLYENYVASVHWFMLVFHGPSLKIELEEILSSGLVSRHKLPWAMLVLTILALGAAYTPASVAKRSCPGWDLTKLRSRLIRAIEEKFLHMFDNGDVEAVAACILVSSYYLYHGQPKRGWITIGAGWRAAEAMGLHQEGTWVQTSKIELEVRRRVWWALYTADAFMALSYGKPRMIPENNFNVSMLRDLDDTNVQCPGYEAGDSGGTETVTILTYQRYKFEFYRATANLTSEIYGRRQLPKEDLIPTIKRTHLRIAEIWDGLPAELRLSSFKYRNWQREENDSLRVFQLQAVSLQLLYDNVQLILHRPLLQYDVTRLGRLVPKDTGEDAFISTSRSQMWESAMRTSRLGEQAHLLRLARNTHAAAYIAIQAFTAGVTLGLFAISSPFSRRSQIAKQAIGRLIKAPKSLGYYTAASEQYGLILHDLIQLVFKAEMQCLERGPELNGALDHGGSTIDPQYLPPRRPFSQMTAPPDDSNRISLPAPDYQDDQYDHSSPNPTRTADDTANEIGFNHGEPDVDSWFSAGSLDDALTSLQQHVFRDFGGVGGDGDASKRQPTDSTSTRVDFAHASTRTTGNSSPFGIPHSAGLAVFGDVGQTWIWEDLLNGGDSLTGDQHTEGVPEL